MKLRSIFLKTSIVSLAIFASLSLMGQVKKDSIVLGNLSIEYDVSGFYDRVIVNEYDDHPGITKQYIYKREKQDNVPIASMLVVYVGYPITPNTEKSGESLSSDETIENRRILLFKNIETGLYSREDYLDNGAIFLNYHDVREEDQLFFNSLLNSASVKRQVAHKEKHRICFWKKRYKASK